MIHTLTCNDGAVFHAKSAAGVVSKMKRQQWNAPERKQPYMLEVIDRVSQVTRKPWVKGVPSPKNFLDYLTESGVATYSISYTEEASGPKP